MLDLGLKLLLLAVAGLEAEGRSNSGSTESTNEESLVGLLGGAGEMAALGSPLGLKEEDEESKVRNSAIPRGTDSEQILTRQYAKPTM